MLSHLSLKTLKLLPVVSLLLSLLLCVAAQAEEWRLVRVKDGMQVLSRSVEGERFPEFRIQTSTKVPTERLAAYLMGRSIDESEPDIIRTVIDRSPQSATFTDLIKTPVISDRCCTTRMWLEKGHQDGEVLIHFASLGEWPKGKPTASCVPVRAHGTWSFKPNSAGTELTYTIFADPGGHLPVFLVRGMIEDDALDRVRKLIADLAG